MKNMGTTMSARCLKSMRKQNLMSHGLLGRDQLQMIFQPERGSADG